MTSCISSLGSGWSGWVSCSRAIVGGWPAPPAENTGGCNDSITAKTTPPTTTPLDVAQQLDRGLAAGCHRPVRTLTGCLVRAQPAVVAATRCGACCLSLVAPCICWRVGGPRDVPVEALFPECRKRFEWGSSGWSRVLGIDAVGGAPHCDFTDEGGARMTSRWCPDWRGVTLASMVHPPLRRLWSRWMSERTRRRCR